MIVMNLFALFNLVASSYLWEVAPSYLWEVTPSYLWEVAPSYLWEVAPSSYGLCIRLNSVTCLSAYIYTHVLLILYFVAVGCGHTGCKCCMGGICN